MHLPSTRMRGLCAVFWLAAAALLWPAAVAAQSGTRVLEYDKSGKAKVRSQDLNGSGESTGATRFTDDPTDPINQVENGELVVLDPPRGFTDVISSMGYRILEATNLDALGSTMYRLRIPRGHTVPDARQELTRRFPGATIDANHNFESQARQIDHARGAMGWPLAAANCGQGIRIG